MSTIQSVVSWGEPLPDDGSIAFNYSGPERAAVTRGGSCGDHLPLSFPTPTESCDFSNFCYPQASYEHSYYSPDHSVTAFSSPVEYGQTHNVLLQRAFTPLESTSPHHRHHRQPQPHSHQQPHYSNYPSGVPEPQARGHLRVQTHGFHSGVNSPAYGSFGQPVSAEIFDDEVNADSQPSVLHHPRPPKLRRVSKVSDISSTISSTSFDSPDAENNEPHDQIYSSLSKQEQQHERTRQKNRLAASKCREKSKRAVDDLRERERALSTQKRILTECAAELKDEVLALKHEILRHAHCDCEYIQNYLTAAAHQVS